MIYNKSGHPIEVKKISIRLWTLRDEIEAALEDAEVADLLVSANFLRLNSLQNMNSHTC